MRRVILSLVAVAFLAAPAAALGSPAWNLTSLAAPTNFIPGDSENSYYQVEATNIGADPTSGDSIVLTDTLPAGLTVTDVELWLREVPGRYGDFGATACDEDVVGAVTTVSCEVEQSMPGTTEPAILGTGERLTMVVHVATPPAASGPLVNGVAIEGGGAAAVSTDSQNEASATLAPAGLAEFRAASTGLDGLPVNQAAAHPFAYATSFSLHTELAEEGSPAPLLAVGGDPKNIEVALPPGLIGNPMVATRCTAAQFTDLRLTEFGGSSYYVSNCPDSSAVGTIAVRQVEGRRGGDILGAVYNLVPPPGMPGQFGFQVAGLPIYIDTELRSGADYGVTARLRNISQVKRVSAAEVTLWGVPGDPRHDRQRGFCAETGGQFSCDAEVPEPLPFLRLPTSCAQPRETTMGFDTWQQANAVFEVSDLEAALVGCEQPDFDPSIEAKPTTNVADSPSGLNFNLHIPQNEDPEELAEADLKVARVTLPPDLLVNPASADGLDSCSPGQIGLTTPVGQTPARFTPAPANCPAASKVGSVEVDTPLIDHPLPGSVYLASQNENPFNSLLAVYITVDDPVSGVVVKLPGKVEPNPITGQLTTTVADGPQTPFEDFKLRFFGGARAPLRTPATCGSFATSTSLTPHTAPFSGPPATPSDSFTIAIAPGGGACAASPAGLPNAPSFRAGSVSPTAGAFSPFVSYLTRADGAQELKGMNVTLPPGLVGKLAGVAECSLAAIEAAARKSGRQERATPSCPASSQVGTVTVGAGAGPTPYYVRGSAYLSGPYKGAPLSLAIVTPAVAGPFDLGTVVVKAALSVDPETAQVAVKSDPIPTILQGIKLDIRSISVSADRSQFTLNPTSCEPKSIGAEAISVLGQVASLSSRFQVGGCKGLGFAPKLSLKLKGGTTRNENPKLRAELTTRNGDASIAGVSVALPHSEFLDQSHIRTICTRVQFAADRCPPGSVYGRARAISPLLDKPLEGPVYLRSSSHPLPDLVIDLKGQIRITLAGRLDSIRGGIRSTFKAVPDAPVSKFVLEFKGGKKSLLVNSRNLCRSTNRATVKMTGQNGKRHDLRPVLRNECGKKKK